MTTVHATTATQKTVDGPSNSMFTVRGRCACLRGLSLKRCRGLAWRSWRCRQHHSLVDRSRQGELIRLSKPSDIYTDFSGCWQGHPLA